MYNLIENLRCTCEKIELKESFGFIVTNIQLV